MASRNYRYQRIYKYHQYNHQQKEKSFFAWTGFRGRTLWDILVLLLLPIVIASGTLWFTAEQSRASEKASAQQHQTDLQIANDQQQEAALQTYLDRMSDLILNNHLTSSTPDSGARNVAYSRTITILPQLNSLRKGEVIIFLYNSGLIIGSYKPIPNSYPINDSLIDLQAADLENANLGGAFLARVNLIGTDLTDANLGHAFLEGADLRGANLRKVDLSGTDLSDAHLGEILLTSNVYHATSTSLEDANLSGAVLGGVNLESIDLSDTNLSSANLRDTNMELTDLTGANLIDADLTNANLTGAKVTLQQLATARSLEGTTMPDGTKHP